jgi:serine/threonine-protein kinase
VIGKQVGHYRVGAEVGEDGLGVLYLAQHVAAGFPAVLRHFFEPFTDVSAVARYLDIARAASATNHPNIWLVRESVWSGRNAFVVGDPLPRTGETAKAALERETRFLPEIVVKLGYQLASALAIAHAQSVYHSYLRTDAIWIHPDPDSLGGYRALIMDFGVAAFVRPGAPNFREPRMEALGVPYTLSPEQCRTGMVDFRSDIYSLGCVLFHMTCGRPPFPGKNPEQIADSHRNQPTHGPGEYLPEVPVELNMLVERMLIKEPAMRPSMPEVAFELDAIWKKYWPPASVQLRTVQVPELRVGVPPPPVEERQRRRWPIVAAVAGLGLVGGGLALAIGQPWKHAAAPVVDANPVATAPPTPTPAQTPTPTPPPARPLSAKEQAIEDAKKALLEERWNDALAHAQKAQEYEPDNRTAAILVKQARTEPANKKAYEDFMKSVGDRDPKKALPKLAKIPNDSLYARRAKEAWGQLRKEYVAMKTAEAKSLADNQACPKIAQIESQVAELFPEDAAAIRAIGKGCAK